jgi:carbon-monoxide dehydrogenase medium subunit
MYRLPEYDYYKPRNLEEALKLLDKLGDARVLAGGTDLILDMKTGRYKPKSVIDIGGLKELKYIIDTGEALRIGALTTIQELVDSPIVYSKTPLLWEAATRFAYWQIRNMATIGGNLCNASPAADTAPPLLVYDAVVKAASLSGERYIPIGDFFLGPRHVSLGRSELLVEVIVPYKSLEKYGSAYAKIGRRRGHDISVVAAAAAIRVEDGLIADARVALNSIAPTPIRARSVEKYLVGRRPGIEVFREASKLVSSDVSPITDVRAPAEYRLHAAMVLVEDLLLESYKRAFRGGQE